MAAATGAHLTLAQWLSPAFPLGAFAWSHGLETAIARGEVDGPESLARWLGHVLALGAGRTDAVLVAHALAAPEEAGPLADLARALAPSAERLAETEAQGAAFARTVAGVAGRPVPEAPLPVAYGVAAADLDLAQELKIALYLHAFASNLVSVAVRFVPLGQTEGQAVLAGLHPPIAALAQAAGQTPLDAIGSAVFGADLGAMEHETQAVRLFRS
jgi:urease accessory protein